MGTLPVLKDTYQPLNHALEVAHAAGLVGQRAVVKDVLRQSVTLSRESGFRWTTRPILTPVRQTGPQQAPWPNPLTHARSTRMKRRLTRQSPPLSSRRSASVEAAPSSSHRASRHSTRLPRS